MEIRFAQGNDLDYMLSNDDHVRPEVLRDKLTHGEIIVLALDVPEGLAARGDGDRLAQVFTNLLDNAVAHTAAGGKVLVAAHPHEQRSFVEVVVTDTGEGIPSDELPRVFERFYQVDKARRRSRGAGLGLAITKEIVEAHGGAISVESVVGLGSKFTVRLPAPVGGE